MSLAEQLKRDAQARRARAGCASCAARGNAATRTRDQQEEHLRTAEASIIISADEGDEVTMKDDEGDEVTMKATRSP